MKKTVGGYGQPTCGPQGDEVSGAIRRCQPRALHACDNDVDQVRDEQRKTGELHRTRQLDAYAARRGHLVGGHCGRTSFPLAAKIGWVVLIDP